MKSITLKADDKLDAELTRLATHLNMTRSAVIRAALVSYRKTIEREELARCIREASLKTRQQATDADRDLDAAVSDGL